MAGRQPLAERWLGSVACGVAHLPGWRRPPTPPRVSGGRSCALAGALASTTSAALLERRSPAGAAVRVGAGAQVVHPISIVMGHGASVAPELAWVKGRLASRPIAFGRFPTSPTIALGFGWVVADLGRSSYYEPLIRLGMPEHEACRTTLHRQARTLAAAASISADRRTRTPNSTATACLRAGCRVSLPRTTGVLADQRLTPMSLGILLLRRSTSGGLAKSSSAQMQTAPRRLPALHRQ